MTLANPALAQATDAAPGPETLTSLFQPIVQLDGYQRRLVAVEALARGPRKTAYESPLALFAAARLQGTVADLDRRCILSALHEALALPRDIDVFLNVHPTTLCNDVGFPAFLADAAQHYAIAPSRLTIELLEHSRISSSECHQLKANISVIRGLGMRLAVDDVSGMPDDVRRALAVRPDFLKVCGELVRGALTDLRARAQLDAIAHQARRAGAVVIAEGIESPAVLDLAVSAGIRVVQGYLIGRPVTVGQLLLATT